MLKGTTRLGITEVLPRDTVSDLLFLVCIPFLDLLPLKIYTYDFIQILSCHFWKSGLSSSIVTAAENIRFQCSQSLRVCCSIREAVVTQHLKYG